MENDRYNILPYNRQAAISYAHTWSFRRNPNYLDFSDLGGDCTNFISQCLYAGSHIMNYTPIYGWYYNTSSDRTASWTGVKFLHKFLTTNQGVGPFGREVSLEEAVPGDISQWGDDEQGYHHTQIIVQIGSPPTLENTLIATHSIDSDYRPLSTYNFTKMRFIHIEGVRI